MKKEHDYDLIVYVDGSCKGNPGPGGVGYVFVSLVGDIIGGRGKYIGMTTNNRAEYEAFLFALQEMEKGMRTLFCTDSELVFSQLIGGATVVNPVLERLNDRVRNLLRQKTKSYEISLISRKDNMVADRLAKAGSHGMNVTKVQVVGDEVYCSAEFPFKLPPK